MLREFTCTLVAICAFSAPAGATSTLLDDLAPGSGSSYTFGGGGFFHSATTNGWTYFTTQTNQLWRTDGTMANTTLLAGPSSPTCCWSNLAAVNGSLIFLNSNGLLGVSDGSPAGTALLNLSGFANGISVQNWENLPGQMLVVTQSASGYNVWVSDGSQTGTHSLLTLPLSPVATVNFAFLPGQKLVIGGPGGLWVTASSTSLPTSIASGFDVSSPLVSNGSQLYFAATDATHGNELWTSDLTAAGTHLVADLAPGSASSAISPDAVNSSIAYFHVGDDLWKSDGTSAGTVQLSSGVIVGRPIQMLDNGLALFVGQQDDGFRVWKSDGTPGGTASYTRVLGQSSPVVWEVNVGDQLMFATDLEDNNPNVFTTSGASDDLTSVGLSLTSTSLLTKTNQRFGRATWILGVSGAHADFIRSDSRDFGEISYDNGSNFTTIFPGISGGSNFFSVNKTTTTGYEPYVTDLTQTAAPICSEANATLPATRSDTILIPQHTTAHNLTVDLRIDYPFVGNLAATLTHVESGKTVTLFNRPTGCGGQDLDVVFDDLAAQPLTAATCSVSQPAYPAGQLLKPAGSLSQFIDEDLYGTWTITVTNSNIRDRGGIVEWCVDTSGVSDVIFRNTFD